MNKLIQKGISQTEKSLCIYDYTETGDINTYTIEGGYKIITKEQFAQLRKNPNSSTHLLIKKNIKDGELSALSMKKQLKAIMSEGSLLKQITKDKINIFKTATPAKAALNLFYEYFNKSGIKQPEFITESESMFIENCFNGALIYGIPYCGKGYKYDVCSEYPSILRSEHMNFPMYEGIIVTLKADEVVNIKFYKYGIYRCKVIDADFRLFRTNERNVYTHIDLNRALELKYKIQLIEDGNPNALLYEGKLVNASKIFREYIDDLFQYKKEGYSCVKKYINVMPGALCKQDIMKINSQQADKKNEMMEIHDDKEILTIMPLGKDINSTSQVFETVRKSKRYETNFARLKPFLVAKGRYMISKIIEKNLENVVYCHTDGIVLKKRVKDVKLGSDIGELKFEEKSKKCEIINGVTKKGFAKNNIDVFEKLKQQHDLASKTK